MAERFEPLTAAELAAEVLAMFETIKYALGDRCNRLYDSASLDFEWT